MPPKSRNRVGGSDGDDAEVRTKDLFDLWHGHFVNIANDEEIA